MKPGLHPVSMAAYCADQLLDVPTLNAGTAHRIYTRSPYHAWFEHPRLNPNCPPDHSKPADVGTAAHALLLQSDESGIAVIDAGDFRTKAAREQRDSAYANGQTPVLACKLDEVRLMVKVARTFIEHSEIKGVFESGLPEQTVVTQIDGVWCRARPDWLNDELCLHYKTCMNAEPSGWIRGQLQSQGYDIAHQFYEQALQTIGRDVRSVFLVQEAEAPYACSLVGLNPAMQDLAARKLAIAMRLWRRCLERDEWPAYPTRICYAEPKPWQIAELDEVEMRGFMEVDEVQQREGLEA